jgi:hypothetical protein
MSKVTVKPKLTAAQSAWVAAYVAKHGPIAITVAGWPATMDAAGAVTIVERMEAVEVQLAVSPPPNLGDDVKAAAAGWVDGWRERGGVG